MHAELAQRAIGWASSAVLVLTIGRQVWKQWQEGRSEGVSSWLFLGQTAASIGFTTYSLMVGDWVFVVTNALMLVNGVLGYVIVLHNRRRLAARSPGAAGRGEQCSSAGGRTREAGAQLASAGAAKESQP